MTCSLEREEKQENNEKAKTILLILAAAVLVSGAISYGSAFGGRKLKSLKARVDGLLEKELVDADPVGNVSIGCVIYVLGGSDVSLILKFRLASVLERQGKCRRILILHRKGKTEFNCSLGRNLTNDEWALIRLEKLGIPRQMWETAKMREGFFGIFAAAKGISRLARKRRYKNMVLNTGAPHTHRARISFENSLRGSSIRLYAVASDEQGFFTEHLLEYVKLKVYELILVRRKR